MNIQFIVTGWHFNQNTLINGLDELCKNNSELVSVYWACHKEPPKFVKDNFQWKLYPNLGMADGGYEQAINDLQISDNTICFFMQDDVIMKDWSFITRCIELLKSFKFIGNCANYSSIFDPNKFLERHKLHIKDLAKESTRHLFDSPIHQKNIKGSFICCLYKDIKELGFFEPIFHYPELVEPFFDKKTKSYRTRKEKGLGGIGNVIQNLLNYKINKVFGSDSITYLSDQYLDSVYMYECARGEIDPNRPPKL